MSKLILPALDRRKLLFGAAALGGLTALPAAGLAQALPGDTPFTLGVASGDPWPDGFVIWTRLAPKPLDWHSGMSFAPKGVHVGWEVASDENFAQVVQKGDVIAYAELGHSVHVEVTGLQPLRPYWYRFTYNGFQSPAGRAKTAPVPGQRLDHVRFAAVGCQQYDAGFYTAYRHVAEEDLDFVFHYGDYIYEAVYGDESKKPRHIGADEPFSLDDYRRRYALYKLDPDLQAAHINHTWWVTLDDHEIQDNWAGVSDKYGTPPEIFLLRRQAAFQAYYENMPLRKSSMPRGPDIQLYRKAVYGDLMNANFMDTRQFRTDQPCDDGFKAYCQAAYDPHQQMINGAEDKWINDSLHKSEARWNLVAQQVMMMDLDRRNKADAGAAPLYNMDSWTGYPLAQQKMVDHFHVLGNVVVLTGDEHQNFAGELRAKGREGPALAVEFVATSISSGGNGSDSRAGTDILKTHNPELVFENDNRGYIVCDVTRDVWRTDYRVLDYVHEQGAPVKTRASFAVERGQAKLNLV